MADGRYPAGVHISFPHQQLKRANDLLRLYLVAPRFDEQQIFPRGETDASNSGISIARELLDISNSQ